jgi:hypothetical protein
MIDQLGKPPVAYLRYLSGRMKRILQNAAQVLLIWQVAIVDASEKPALLVSPDAKGV